MGAGVARDSHSRRPFEELASIKDKQEDLRTQLLIERSSIDTQDLRAYMMTCSEHMSSTNNQGGSTWWFLSEGDKIYMARLYAHLTLPGNRFS